MTLKQSSAVHIRALVSADVILPGSSSKLRLLVINLASVPGRQLSNTPNAESLETLAAIMVTAQKLKRMKRVFILIFTFLLFLKAFSQSQSDSEKARLKSYEVLNTVFKQSLTRVRFEYVSTIERMERYSIKYKVFYSDLNYTGSLFIDIDRQFELYDSTFYYEIPEFILQNSKVDLISTDSALNIAKRNGLCLEDILDIRLLRHYEKKYFMWLINTDSSKEKSAAKKKYKTKTTIRAVIPCRERIVDARTGEIIPSL